MDKSIAATQERPFNNEVKLSYPNVRDAYSVLKLDCIDRVGVDFGMPRGVVSRRSFPIFASCGSAAN